MSIIVSGKKSFAESEQQNEPSNYNLWNLPTNLSRSTIFSTPFLEQIERTPFAQISVSPLLLDAENRQQNFGMLSVNESIPSLVFAKSAKTLRLALDK
jgi:hypothetical protein